MAREIIMVTGGQRSGKSLFAEELALQRSDRPEYIATAEARDDEFRCYTWGYVLAKARVLCVPTPSSTQQ